jgi:DNA-binding protein HU-beta
MTKAELVGKIANGVEISRKKASAALDCVLASIKEAVCSGEVVTFIGFGSFKMVERAAREGRNPTTGMKLKIPAKKAVKFTAGKAFKESLNVVERAKRAGGSSHDVVKLLIKIGYTVVPGGGKGSHIKLSKPGCKTVTVPANREDLSYEVCRNIAAAIGLRNLHLFQSALAGVVPIEELM